MFDIGSFVRDPLSVQLGAMPGKSGPDGSWLPSWEHMVDTAACAAWLLDARYPDAHGIARMSKDEFESYVVLLALLHDMGKFTAAFAHRILRSVPGHRGVMEKQGIRLPDEIHRPKMMHHTRSGEAILVSLGYPKGFSSVAGAHHGMPSDRSEKFDRSHVDGNGDDYGLTAWGGWRDVWSEWSDRCLAAVGYASVADVPSGLPQAVLAGVSGLLVLADWMASNTDHFGLAGPDEIPVTYPLGRADAGVGRAGLTTAWDATGQCMTDEGFKARFGFAPNAVQAGFLDVVRRAEGPGLYILEAPMGCGKTEAALAAAEVLAHKFDKHGVFFGLPTQATANSMFSRGKDWVERLDDPDFHSINLAHGMSAFSPDFLSVPRELPEIGEDRESGLLVQSFFEGSKRALLPDFCFGTVDRLLMAALRRKHAMLLHLGLWNKVAVIDEVHAYDAYMSVYLDRALRWLGEYGVPVVLLSATLPRERRDGLLAAYAGRGADVPEAAYPRVSWTDADGVPSAAGLPADGVAGKSVRLVRTEDSGLPSALADAVRAGACVGVICNSVVRAQRAAESCRAAGASETVLYHAQFVAPDRLLKEKEIIRLVGSGSGPSEREGAAVAGTQVLEQSLDLDFDVLATDICPIDLLLQRLGREFRHAGRERPRGYRRPVCYVLCSDEAVRTAERIYGKWPIRRTLEILFGGGATEKPVSVPGDVDGLVASVYLSREDLSKEGPDALAWLRDGDASRRRANGYLIGEPQPAGRRERTLRGWLSCETGTSEDAAVAAVRDGVASVEAVVLVGHPDGTVGFLPWRDAKIPRFRPDAVPDGELGKAIAGETMRLGYTLSGPRTVGRTLRELEEMSVPLAGLRKSPWLRDALFLVLDENLKAKLSGYELSYGEDDGLVAVGPS